MTGTAYPLVEGLFTTDGENSHLIGGRCSECESYFFPIFAEYHRPNCSGGPVERVLLSQEGVLVSWTIAQYPPPPPYPLSGNHVPFPLGTIEIPEGLQIPAQLVDFEEDQLTVGTRVRLVIDTLFVDADGAAALTWKFRPAT